MAENIYTNTDVTKNVKFNRGEMEDRIENIYANVDQHPLVSVTSERSFSRVAAVCLGLLCVLLLAGIIVLGVYYTGVNRDKTRLIEESHGLQTQYDQLQTLYNNLTNENGQLLTSNEHLTRERDDLQKRCCESNNGWKAFGSRCYYVSNEEKPWNESRDDCIRRRADLVVINSREEQGFLSTFKKRVWIGLTDRAEEGTWKWVDTTPLTTVYWSNGQPDDYQKREDCAEILNKDPERNWNDEACGNKRHWICERGI